MIQTLSSLNLRFYMYTQNNISHQDDMWPNIKDINNGTMASVVVPAERRRPDIRIYFPFVSHPLRTLHREEADLFLVPAPWRLLNIRQFRQTIKTLMLQPEFRSNANKHFVISPKSYEFDKKIKDKNKKKILEKYGHHLQKMTIVKDKDDELIKQIRQQHHNWGRLFDNYAHSYLDHVVSMGLQDFKVPYRPASWERFMQEQNIWLFFHPREEPFENGSSLLRFALMNTTWPTTHFSPISVGYDLPAKEWLHDYLHSKFCLVMRGDDPASKSLPRAIHAGCLPVIVSDYLPMFSPPFRHTVNLKDFSIIIQEEDFLQDPVGSMLSLQKLEESLLKEKISQLQIAQQILCPDHPESLFVPAFLKEVYDASR